MKILKIHKEYYINFINLILISLLVISAIFIFIFNLSNNNNYFERIDNKNSYLETLILYFKLILVIIFCFIGGNFFSFNNDSYHLLIPNYYQKKTKYFFTKYLVCIALPIIVCFLIFFSFSLIAVTGSNWYMIDKRMLKLFLSLIFMVIIYLNYAVTFTLLINSIFSCFIPGLIYVLMQILSEYNSLDKVTKILELFFPLIKLDYINYSRYGLIHLGLILFLNIIINYLLYLFKRRF